MAAKLLHSLADDNPDLQKQIGCMTGIFQIFDPHHFVYGRGRPNQRRLLPPPLGDSSKYNNGQSDADSGNVYNQEETERNPNANPNRSINEKQRASTESSRASFSSSSRSSSFSSLDCAKLGQPDPSSIDRIIFPETPSRDPVISQTSASPKMGRVSLDLRDVVKDSMYRDSRGSSVHTPIKDEASTHKTRDKDSSRESLRILSEFRDGQWYYAKKEHPRLSYESKEGSFPKDLPRFSYDGRDLNRKIKDVPRLSLDNRESSKSSQFKHSDERIANGLQSSRPSSIVAKLMGLDTLPDTKPLDSSPMVGPVKMFPIEDFGHSLKPLRTADGCRPVRLPKSPRSSRKDPNSPRWRNSDAVMKPVTSSKNPIEPAPWKHMESGRVSPKQASNKQVKSSTSTSSTSPSVYGEIEKRLKDIEFKQSGKDLRALKQILETMHAKGFLEGNKEEQSSRNDDQRFSSKHRVSGSNAVSESPIVIMKPAKLVQKSDIITSSIIPFNGIATLQRPQIGEVVTQQTSPVSIKMRKGRKDEGASSGDRKANNRYPRVAQTSSKSTQVAKDNNNTTVLKNSGSSTSPRLQKKVEFDRRSRPPTPPDSNISKRPPNRPSNESCPPIGRRRPKNHIVQQSDEQVSAKGGKLRDMGVTSAEPLETVNCQSGYTEALERSMPKETNNDVKLRLCEEDMRGDVGISLEQPSPISVLDSCEYMEDSPSPVKQTSHALHADTITESNHNPEENIWKSEESLSTNTTVLHLPSEINRKKLQSIDNLVQKLRRLNSTHDENQTDYIASLCDNSNPDHRYISEILLASGLLLRDLTSGLTPFQLHPSGHPINPELFFVLEQTKSSSLLAKGDNEKSKPEKFHRKFIFDAVNEILTQKLAVVGPIEPWLKPNKLAKKTLNAQVLLRELCAEIEAVQAKKQDSRLNEEEEEDGLKTVLWEDVMCRSGNWIDFEGEVSGIVLDVERSIFKELVNEVIIGEANGRRVRPNRRCRQLFSK